MTAAISMLLASSVLAFGGVYPWAYVPLLVGAAIVGIAGLQSPTHGAVTSPALLVALVAVGAAVVVQLVPLPRPILRSVSAEFDPLSRQISFDYAQTTGPRPLSIGPRNTALALMFFVCLATFLAGASRHFNKSGTGGFATALTAIGLVVALIGLVQRSFPIHGRVYGFWTPQSTGDIFGPFVNKDHFAGWMLMAVPVVLGNLAGRLATAMRGLKAGWRRRVEWLATDDANAIGLVTAAATIMALSLLLALSRSAIMAFAITVLIWIVWVARMPGRPARRIVAVGGILIACVLALSWAGLDRLTGQFSGSATARFYRVAIWRDAWHIASLFPLTGIGLNTFGIAMSFYKTVPIDMQFRAAHSDYLQIAAEGGVLLAVPVAVAIALFVREVGMRVREGQDSARGAAVRAGAIIGIVAIGLQEMVDFALQIPANALLFTVLCAMAIHRAPAHARQ